MPGRLDVLIDVEEIAGIVLGFDFGKPRIIVSVGGFDVIASLIHHHVDVGAAGREPVQGLPIILRPLYDPRVVRGSGSTPTMTSAKFASRKLKAVSSRATRCAAPLMG